MKTFEQVCEKAVQISDNDPNARVAVFDLHVRQKVFNSECYFNSGVLNSRTMMYQSNSGGTVRFYDAGQELWPVVAGCQFTHVFCSDYVCSDEVGLIATKIRHTTQPRPEPSGFYDFYGTVQRTETW